MKNILLVFLMVSALFFAVSCSEDDIDDALGGSCDVEGTETCSSDGAQILVCSDYTWQVKKACNINFGQYCRQTASGSYSCTDSGNGGNNDGGDTDTLPETDDNDSTDSDTEPAGDTDSTDSESADDSDSSDDGDTQPSDNDNDTDTGAPEPEEDPIPAPGDCANIMTCLDSCEVDSEGNLIDSTCPQTCYNNGTSTGQTQYAAWQTCNENNSCKGYYDCLWKKCRDEDAVCGLAGDTVNYKIPYGKANISGTFTYLHSEDENWSNANGLQGGFLTGTFGKTNVKIVDDPSSVYAFATFFPEETTTEGTSSGGTETISPS